MNKINLLEWARACFSNDLYATQATGISIKEVSSCGKGGEAVCEIELQPHHLNARGAVMGGVFFTLADFAAGVAVNLAEALPRLGQEMSQEELFSLHWVSTNSTIHFLSQPKGKKITAYARCLRQGRTTGLYQVEVKEDDRLLALVTTTGMRV